MVCVALQQRLAQQQRHHVVALNCAVRQPLAAQEQINGTSGCKVIAINHALDKNHAHKEYGSAQRPKQLAYTHASAEALSSAKQEELLVKIRP